MKRRTSSLLALVLLALTLLALAGFVPALAQDLGSEAQREAGKSLYDKFCSQCHGIEGDGRGVAAPALMPRPRDFTSGKYKIRATPSGALPTDQDLKNIIRRGMPYTSMPAWPQFTEEELTNIVYYVKSLSEDFSNPELVPNRLLKLGETERSPVQREAQTELTCHDIGRRCADVKRDSAGYLVVRAHGIANYVLACLARGRQRYRIPLRDQGSVVRVHPGRRIGVGHTEIVPMSTIALPFHLEGLAGRDLIGNLENRRGRHYGEWLSGQYFVGATLDITDLVSTGVEL